ncbi:MAG: hypothetical protein WEB58_17310 [Planctomycetaceae bacterium]
MTITRPSTDTNCELLQFTLVTAGTDESGLRDNGTGPIHGQPWTEPSLGTPKIADVNFAARRESDIDIIVANAIGFSSA